MTTYATIGIIGIILAFFSQKVRQLIYSLLSQTLFIFVRKTYLHRTLGDAFIVHMVKSGFKNKKFAGELYGEDTAFIRSENEVRHLLYRDFHSNTQLFYGKGWPIVVSGTPLIRDNTKTVRDYSYIIYSFRWSNKLVKLLDDATENKNEAADNELESNQFVVKRVSGGKFFREKNPEDGGGDQPVAVSEFDLSDPFSSYVPVKWEKDNIGQLVYHNTLDMMSLNQELEDLVEEVKFWFDSQEWYEERGIPWKRGLLLYGKPGTGKTMFTRALAEKLNIPLIIFDLASMNNTEFTGAWNQILPKRIALFEDFDAVFNKRENIVSDDLTFDCILNCLDGADKKQGVLTIITTNHPEKLDFALGGPNEDGDLINGRLKMPTRPGRIDRAVEFLPLNRPGRLKLALRIMKDPVLAEQMVDASEHDSAAQLQERCFRTAVEILFNKKAQAKKTVPVQHP